ncbi:dUTP diphosphatase [Candidatus Babeliales bacterium]|nr:dUTP diphosphatase [Candidatus Babeliales bacterium]
MEIEIILDSPYVDMPTYATPGSAAIDLRSSTKENIVIPKDRVVYIPTGIHLNMPVSSMAALLLPRSGLASKYGLILANTVGLIDSDYQDEILVALKYTGTNKSILIEPGYRVAQLMFIPILIPTLTRVAEFSNTTERTGGFGSTGVK